MNIPSKQAIAYLQNSQKAFDLAIQKCQKKSNVQFAAFEAKMAQLIEKITKKLVTPNSATPNYDSSLSNSRPCIDMSNDQVISHKFPFLTDIARKPPKKALLPSQSKAFYCYRV